MPRVKEVVARKDYPQFGIVKGQKHFHWKLMTSARSSREFRQVTPPRPSQLTTSEFMGTIGDIELEFDNLEHGDGLVDELRDIAERVRDAGEQAQERFDNMPEGLQQGTTGQLLEERASNAAAWADDIEAAAETLAEELDTIDGKDWHELEEFSDLDPEDEDFDPDSAPSEDEIEAAKTGEKANAYENAIDACTSSNPGFA